MSDRGRGPEHPFKPHWPSSDTRIPLWLRVSVQEVLGTHAATDATLSHDKFFEDEDAVRIFKELESSRTVWTESEFIQAVSEDKRWRHLLSEFMGKKDEKEGFYHQSMKFLKEIKDQSEKCVDLLKEIQETLKSKGEEKEEKCCGATGNTIVASVAGIALGIIIGWITATFEKKPANAEMALRVTASSNLNDKEKKENAVELPINIKFDVNAKGSTPAESDTRLASDEANLKETNTRLMKLETSCTRLDTSLVDVDDKLRGTNNQLMALKGIPAQLGTGLESIKNLLDTNLQLTSPQGKLKVPECQSVYTDKVESPIISVTTGAGGKVSLDLNMPGEPGKPSKPCPVVILASKMSSDGAEVSIPAKCDSGFVVLPSRSLHNRDTSELVFRSTNKKLILTLVSTQPSWEFGKLARWSATFSVSQPAAP